MQKKNYYKKILSYFLKHKKYLIIYIITSIVTMASGAISPFISAKVVESITNIAIKPMITFSVLLFLISTIEEIIYSFNNHFSSKLQDFVSLDIKKDISKEVFELETKNFDKEGTGFFSSRIEGEPSTIAWTFSSVRHYISSFGTSIGVLIYVFIISYKMAILFMFLALVQFYLRFKRMKIWENSRKEINKLNEEYTSSFGEIIRGIRDIKVLNLKNVMISKVIKEQTVITEKENSLRKKEEVYSTSTWIFRSLADFLIVIMGVYLLHKNEISGANLLILYMYRSKVFSFFDNFTDIYESVKRVNLSIERLFELIDGRKYSKEVYGNVAVSKVIGNIEFKNVNFAYDKAKVLKNVSFKINANETVGFVGKSGQGKSTIFNLISKLYSIKKGEILIDNVNINDLTEATLRSNISVITQSPYIFNMSIKDNLKIVNPLISDEEMIEKCKLCALHDFVETLEDKYDTKVGEGGVTLSGGQKQRLAIARALIKESEIILLDEATSSLDNETQDYIQESIRKISNDYTILIIAHRLSTVKNCDKIIVVDDGKIVDSGTHNELIKSCPTYKKLYQKELI